MKTYPDGQEIRLGDSIVSHQGDGVRRAVVTSLEPLQRTLVEPGSRPSVLWPDQWKLVRRRTSAEPSDDPSVYCDGNIARPGDIISTPHWRDGFFSSVVRIGLLHATRRHMWLVEAVAPQYPGYSPTEVDVQPGNRCALVARDGDLIRVGHALGAISSPEVAYANGSHREGQPDAPRVPTGDVFASMEKWL